MTTSNSMPLISVLMSVHNGDRYLVESVDSILHQTVENFEFIIVDDGSTDHSLEILKAYDDPRIVLVVNEVNIGLTKSLNKALLLARGTNVARQDADDISEPRRFQAQLEYLSLHPKVGAVGTFYSGIDDEGKSKYQVTRRFSSEQLRHFQKGDTALCHGSLMVRREVIKAINGYDEEILKAQDYDLLLRISELYDLGIVPEILYHWRDWSSNISSTSSGAQSSYVKLSQQKARNRFFDRFQASRARQHSVSGQPIFSVIMANFNNSIYISEAIESVINQTAQNWELLICDDASTDDSVMIIEKYLEDPRIRLLRNSTNVGYIATLNRMIKESCGELIGTLDADDALFFDAIDRVVSAHDKNPEAPFVYSQFLYCDEKLRTKNVGYCKKIAPGSSFLLDDCVSVFRTWKRWAIEKIGVFSPEMLYAEDKDFVLRMEEVGPLIYVDEALYRYRVLPESQSHGQKELLSLATYQLATIRAWERRRNTNIPSASRGQAVARAWLGLGLAIRKRYRPYIIIFGGWLLKNPGFGIWHMNCFINGLRGRRT